MKEYKIRLKDLDFWLQAFVVCGLLYFSYYIIILIIAVILTIAGV